MEADHAGTAEEARIAAGIYVYELPAGPTVEEQKAASRKLCAQHDWTVAEVYSDAAGERSAWGRMVEDVSSGKLGAVAASDLDVFFDPDQLIEPATELGAKIALVGWSDPADYSTAKRNRSLEKSARAGEPKRSGSRSYGYEPDGLTVRDGEAEIIREIARRVLGPSGDGSDGESLRAVSMDLNERDIKTATGKSWQALTIRRTLLNPRIAGQRVYRGVVVSQGVWPEIITPATQEKVRLLFADESRRSGTGTSSQGLKYLLTGGRLACGRCGTSMSSQPSNSGRRGYVCRRTPPEPGCGRIRIQAEALENEVADAVLAKLVSPVIRKKMAVALGTDADGRSLSDSIDELENRLVALGRDAADGLIGRTEFLSASKRMNEKLKEQRLNWARFMSLQMLPDTSSFGLATWWEDAKVSQRREVVDLVLERIEVYPSKRRGFTGFDPDRLRWYWRF